MNIAILEFSMEGFEEEYWKDSFYERRNLIVRHSSDYNKQPARIPNYVKMRLRASS